MKSQRIVIFIFTRSETEFALKYIKKHPANDIKIIAASLYAKTQLHKNGIDSLVENSLLYKNKPNYYVSDVVPLYQRCTRLYRFVQKRLPEFKVAGVDLTEVLKILVEPEFLSVLHAYKLYEAIEKTWHPDRYFFSTSLINTITGWDPTSFTEAAIIKQFFGDPTGKFYFNATSDKVYNFSSPYLKKLLLSPRLLRRILRAKTQRIISKLNKKLLPPEIDLLFFSQGHHIYYYRQVFSQILKQKIISFSVITGDQSLEHEWLLNEAQIPFTSLDFFLDPLLQNKIDKEYAKLQIKLTQLWSNDASLNKLFPADYPRALKNALFFRLKLVFEKYTKKFVRQILLAQKVIHLIKPRLVMTTHDPGPSALPFVLQAKKLNLKTIVLLHGFHDLNFGANHKSALIAVWGKLLKQRFIRKLKKPKEKIVPVGFPLLDPYFEKKLAPQKYANNHSPLRLGILMTVYQVDPFCTPRFVMQLFGKLHKIKLPVEIWLRTHSGQTLDGIKNAAALYNINYKYNPDYSLDKFIQNCDVIYCWDTTAIIWAMLYQKPLFYSTPWWGKGYIPVKDYHAGWEVTGAQEFVNKLKSFTKNSVSFKVLKKGQQRFLRDTLGVTDGTSSAKLTQLIYSLIDH